MNNEYTGKNTDTLTWKSLKNIATIDEHKGYVIQNTTSLGLSFPPLPKPTMDQKSMSLHSLPHGSIFCIREDSLVEELNKISMDTQCDSFSHMCELFFARKNQSKVGVYSQKTSFIEEMKRDKASSLMNEIELLFKVTDASKQVENINRLKGLKRFALMVNTLEQLDVGTTFGLPMVHFSTVFEGYITDGKGKVQHSVPYFLVNGKEYQLKEVDHLNEMFKVNVIKTAT